MPNPSVPFPLPFPLGDGAPNTTELIRSGRKTVSLELHRDGRILIRAPRRMPLWEIRQFVKSRETWLREHWARRTESPAVPQTPLTPEEIAALTARAKSLIPSRVRHFAPIVGVDFGRITIRQQKTRWGSCSSAGNLSFNVLLTLVPPDALDYVVVHELCHRLEMNHSPRFWAEVARVLPNYREQKRWFRENGGAVLERLKK